MVLGAGRPYFSTQRSFTQHFCGVIREAKTVSRPAIIGHEFRTIEFIEHGIHLLRHEVHIHLFKTVKVRIIVNRLARWLPQVLSALKFF